jgi:glyoxylase-like metal-dependent hydrolase (beta-lactamase superfamily II)
MLILGVPSEVTSTNCWVVAPAAGEQCVIVDPGVGVARPLEDLVAQHHLKPVAVLLTHGHIDHTFSVLPVCGAHDVPAYIHPDDREQIADPWTRVGLRPGDPILGIEGVTLAEPDDLRLLGADSTLTLAGMDFRAQHAPGHSPGSVVFGTTDERGVPLLLAGDVILDGIVGTTELAGGSMPDMIRSLVRVILPMADETVVYPGHGGTTTIGRERATNSTLIELMAQTPTD